jgi:uncharacterized repeat protein (TIGR01451 family)
MAETRSSQSTTATLSDFALGSFPLCSLAAPQFTGLSKFDTQTGQGDVVTYPLTVQNTGGMPLYIQSVTDSLLGNIVVNHTLQAPTAPVTSITSSFNFSTALAPGQTLTIFVTRPVQQTDPDPTPDTVTFIGTDDLAGTADPISTSVTNSVNLFQPSASLTETASPATATSLGQVITYTFTVNNTSSADSPNLVLDLSNPNDSFTDSLLGNLEADAIHAATGDNTATVASIAPGASFTFTETRAIQAGDPAPLTDTSNVAFTLAQNLGSFSNIIGAGASGSVTLLPHLSIVKAVTDGFPTVIHPGDTASFTITVTNDGAGPATNVVVTDPLPAASSLNWSATSSAFTTSIDTNGVLTGTDASLAAGASATITVSAVVPLDFFGPTPNSALTDPVPLGLFELDGNATTGVLGTSGSTTTSHDWDQVFADAGSPATSGAFSGVGPLSGARAGSFVTDAVNTTSDDIFTGGGSKDTNGIQKGPWLFTDAKPQGKDDITHAFAALYTDPTTKDSILYAGLDRFDNSGDSTAGFWFFVNPVGKGPIAKGNGTGPFSGTHTTGDILLVSDFTQGGSVSTIRVFEWVGDDATGSLVPLNSGNPISGKTFAIVNGSNVTLPWSYTNKSKTPGNVALPGEFLEEGVNLTSLGLNACFSSFMAETRSSQSPTATLSDFVQGSFQTCNVVLPNTATVQADGIPPITSNQALITLNDGDAMLAASVGSGVGTEALTAQQLQAAVAQGISAWAAAGIDPRALSSLDHVSVQLARLPGGELGYTAGGQIWIDQTAAGWGWSTGPAPLPGRMDLATVVTHELGHVLGFEHGSAGVMEASLAPGARLVPEAVAGTSSVMATAAVPASSGVSAGAPSATAPASFRMAELGAPLLSAPPAALARLGTVEAAFTSSVRDSVALPAFSSTATVDALFAAATRALSPAATVQDRLGSLAVAAPVLLPTTATAPAAASAETDRETTSAPVPGVWPPNRKESGNGAALDKQAPALPPANPAELRQSTNDAFFAGDSGADDLADTLALLPGGAAPATGAAAAAALALALGGWWGAQPAATEPRKQKRFLSERS